MARRHQISYKDVKFCSKEELESKYRALFVKALIEKAPEIWDELKRKRQRLFNAAFDKVDEQKARQLYDECLGNPELLKNEQVLNSYLNTKERVENFQEFWIVLNQWAEKYLLDKKWLLSSLFDSFWAGMRDKDTLLKIPVFSYQIPENVIKDKIPPFQPRDWSPLLEYAKKYEEDVKREFLYHIRDYINEKRLAYKEAGYKLYRREPDPERLEWLVLWNYKDWHKKDIAEEYNRSLSAVKSAIKDFENYDLPVKKEKSGRRSNQ